MHQSKPRAFSANRISMTHSNNSKPKQRYERVVTEESQSFQKDGSQTKQKLYVKGQFYRAKPTKSICKQPQKIMQQNMSLKVFINQLQDQLAMQRGRLEMNNKKTFKFMKQINREFDKELYYSGKNPNSYMISGVKQQYQNYKRLYEEKCQQLDNFMKFIDFTNIQEMNTYIETLEYQNKIMKNKLSFFAEIKESNPSGIQLRKSKSKNSKGKQSKHTNLSQIQKLYTEYEQESQTNEGLLKFKIEQLASELAQQKINNARAKEIVQNYQQKCKQFQKELKQYSCKMALLDKVILQKSNNQYNARRQTKKMQKNVGELEAIIKRLKEQYKFAEERYEKKLLQIKQKEQKKYEVQNSIFRNLLEEKSEIILKLQKQIRFLSALLSYWKPLDQLNRQFSGRFKEDGAKQFQQKLNEERVSDSVKLRVNEVHHRTDSMKSDQILIGLDIFAATQNQNQKSFKSNREEEIRKTGGARTQSQQNMVQVAIDKKRIPQTCATKHNQSAKKMRKVNFNQIKNYGKLIRYRLIGSYWKLEKVKQLFNRIQQSFSEQQTTFNNEYISMREVKNKLMRQPFILTDSEAEMVSRYVVEDASGQYVYRDENNEIKRSIAKSIINALIGQYQLSNLDQINKQWQHLKNIYLTNLQANLKIKAPKGVISETEFVDLFVGLGIQLKQNLKDWMIGQMVVQSPSLDQLKYHALIDR